MPYSWISFDCYGTLIDWYTGIRSAVEQALPILTRDQIEDVAGSYDAMERSIESHAYRPYRVILREALAATFYQHGLPAPNPSNLLVQALPTWNPFWDVPRVLHQLKATGHRLAILSNVDRDLIQSSLTQLPVGFDLVITAEDVQSYKPAPRHWEALLANTGVPPSNILHVAAGLHYDIPTAQGLGLSTCWINRRAVDPGSIQPDITLPHLMGLLDALENR